MDKICSLGALIAGVVLAFVALFIPPRGVIDNSGVMVVAQLLIYSASILGVKLYIKDLINKAK